MHNSKGAYLLCAELLADRRIVQRDAQRLAILDEETAATMTARWLQSERESPSS